MRDLRGAALRLDDEQQGPRRARGTGAMLSCAAPCCTWRASTVPTRKAPTLSGATYDNATSPPVAGRVPGRRGDARSHGRPAGPVVPAAPEHATTARVARVLGVGCLCERGPGATRPRRASAWPRRLSVRLPLHLQCAEIGNVGRALESHQYPATACTGRSLRSSRISSVSLSSRRPCASNRRPCSSSPRSSLTESSTSCSVGPRSLTHSLYRRGGDFYPSAGVSWRRF